MRFSYWITNTQPWSEVLAGAQQAESLGYHGIWFADHFMPNAADPVTGPAQEAFTMLAALASTTSRVRLGALVAGNTYRHPAVLAKMCATIDEISGGGRVVVGLGAGWQENEHRAYGIPFETFRWRFDRLEEACQVITGLFREERFSFDGAHYTLVDAPLDPKPATPPPLLIGGGGEQRTLRIAARHAQEWNVWGLPDLLAQKGGVLAQRCEEVGRDPGTIAHSAQALLFLTDDQATIDKMRSRPAARPTIIGTPAEVQEVMGAYREAGVDEFIIPGFTFRSPAERAEVLERFATEVAPALG